MRPGFKALSRKGSFYRQTADLVRDGTFREGFEVWRLFYALMRRDRRGRDAETFAGEK